MRGDRASTLCCFEEHHNWLGYLDESGTRSVAEHIHWVAVNLRTGSTNRSTDLFHYGWRHGLTGKGTVAWIQKPDSWAGHPGSPVKSVYTRAVGAEPQLIDSGADVDLTSLAVGGKHVYWTKAGSARTAVVP